MKTTDMREYADRLVTEATLQIADETGSICAALATTGHDLLSTIAKQPEVIASVNRARAVLGKEHWEGVSPTGPLTPLERGVASAVLNHMPGYCCLMDAVAILARL